MKQKLKEILMNELAYSEYVAEITLEDLCNLNEELSAILEKWTENRTVTDIAVEGFSLAALMEERGFSFPAALIAMDWLLIEPEIAKTELSGDIIVR